MRRPLIYLLVCLLPLGLLAQQTAIYTHPDLQFRNALELFQKQKFGAAQSAFKDVIRANGTQNSILKSDAEYYSALCALELFNRDADLQLRNFIEKYPESTKSKWACFHLGKYQFRKKAWANAVAWFDKVDVYDLNDEERAELYFKRGYSCFELDQTEKAKKDFYELKDIDTQYSGAANYYYSHIAYNEKNYQTALEGFLRLRLNESFGAIVPYYIAQLYYLQNRYDSVIAVATPMLDSANTKRAPEIARIIGESYYRQGKYAEAIPFLKKYEKAKNNLSRDDKYELGYAYYQVKDWDNAIIYFIYASEYEDSTAQSAHYHLADCYLKKNNKQAARAAFKAASKMDYDEIIKEDALFSYAKLCYELSFNPYNEAIAAFRNYIQSYPTSYRTDEAYGYLVNVYLNTSNYREALKSIEGIKNLSPELQAAHQKIVYNRAVQLFNDQQMDSAISYFTKAQALKLDKSINAPAQYWKAEALYYKKDYDKSIEQYKEFMAEPGAVTLPAFQQVNYNVGYCYFRKKEYTEANLWFRKYVNTKDVPADEKLGDAFIRIGDCYFIQGKMMQEAIEFYGEAIKLKKNALDYAYFQRAMANGYEGKTEAKTNDLLALLKEYTFSGYSAEAKYELAGTYLNTDQYDKAITWYQKLVAENPRTKYVVLAKLKIGSAYFAKKEDDKALTHLKDFVKEYPNTHESKEAISQIQKIYVSKDQLDEFKTWLEGTPYASVTKASLDSSYYEVAKNHFFDGNCDKAVKSFDAYLERYPDGLFTTEAVFFKAECSFHAKDYKTALAGYNSVIEKPVNDNTEDALVKAAWINFSEKNYSAANENYVRLESVASTAANILLSRSGQMRCNFEFKNYEAAIKYAKEIQSTEKIEPTLQKEANYIIAKSAYETKQYDLATQNFQMLISQKNEKGAEARYYLAQMQYLKGDYAESKKIIFDLVKNNGSYKYWLTRSLILLADNYLGLGDKFQAKTTLQSVIDDSGIPELAQEAKQKMDQILESEKPKTETVPVVEDKIELNDNKEDINLFKDDGKSGGGRHE